MNKKTDGWKKREKYVLGRFKSVIDNRQKRTEGKKDKSEQKDRRRIRYASAVDKLLTKQMTFEWTEKGFKNKY